MIGGLIRERDSAIIVLGPGPSVGSFGIVIFVDRRSSSRRHGA